VEYDGIAALASLPAVAALAPPPPLGPGLGLGFDNPLLGGGEQKVALGKRQSEIFRAVGAFAQGCDLFDVARRAVIGCYLKQNLHAHDVTPEDTRPVFHWQKNENLQ
jgi:hypothetical protein